MKGRHRGQAIARTAAAMHENDQGRCPPAWWKSQINRSICGIKIRGRAA
jgi:hypothetical protein